MKSIYTIEIIKKSIEDDTKAYLLTDEVIVDAVESESEGKDCVSVGILIHGLSYSFTCEIEDIQTTFEVALKMLHAQLCLYAIECLKAKTKVIMPQAFVPEMTNTFIKPNPQIAMNDATVLASVVNSFSIFEGTFYDKNNRGVPKRTAKTK